MSIEEAFIAAIVEAPDDDAQRLIYADWLEEHGQPERAEFIRVQCHLARLDPGTAPFRDYTRWLEDAHRVQDHTDFLLWLCDLAEQDEHAPLRQELRERERVLLEEFSATWTEPLRAMGLHCYHHPFRRGMIESVSLNPEDLLRVYPIRGINLPCGSRTQLGLPWGAAD